MGIYLFAFAELIYKSEFGIYEDLWGFMGVGLFAFAELIYKSEFGIYGDLWGFMGFYGDLPFCVC